MKRVCCLLLALALLIAALPAVADEPAYALFESRFGYTLWVDSALLSAWTEEWEGAYAECFCPLEDHSGVAEMVCRGSRFSALLWDDYARLSLDEPDAAINYPYEVTAYTDGDVVVEQWIVSAAGADFVFIIQYETGDPQGWAPLFHSVLETLEFPAQPAENAAFRLLFFEGGAAGMRFTDVVVDEEADPMVLMPLNDVCEFKLEYVEWEDWEEAEARLLYSAEELSPGDNLRIYAYIPDMLPTLRFSYYDYNAGERLGWYISQSGMDGSLLLLPEDGL